MRNGFSFTDACRILNNKNNRHLISVLITQLEQGKPIQMVLKDFLPTLYRRYFNNFILYLPVLDSLRISVDLAEREYTRRQKLIKELSYPILMFFVMVIGMYIFNIVVFPQMISLMQGFQVNVGAYHLLKDIIMIVSVFLMFCVILILFCGMLLLQEDFVKRIYRRLVIKLPDSLAVQKASEQFACFFLECRRIKIPTIQTMEILMKLKNKPLVNLIASELNRTLLAGDSFHESLRSPYVEHALQQFFQIALHGADCEGMLESYLLMVQQRTAHRIRQLTRLIQVVSYGSIALILLLVYQILMLPMQMLQNI